MARDGGKWLLKRESRDIIGLLNWVGAFVRRRSDWEDMQLSINGKL